MNSITIRIATESDIPSILPLMSQLGYPVDYDTFLNRFKKFTAQEGYGIAVAITEENHVLGFVAWSKSQVLVLDKIRLHIEGIAVDEKYRGFGIGKKLMHFVEHIAKQHGEAVVDLTSGIRRAKDGSHEFYKSLGYKNEGYMAKLYLRKEL